VPQSTEALIQEVSPGIWCQTPPFFLGDLTLYAIEDGGEVLLVDTGAKGFGTPELLLEHLGLGDRLDGVKVFVTHNHFDHASNAAALEARGAQILMDLTWKPRIFDPPAWAVLCGYPQKESACFMDPQLKYLHADVQPTYPVTDVNEGDIITVGSRGFQVIATSGHTMGHYCLFEPETGILFSGDCVIDKIMPIICTTMLGRGELAMAYRSLERLKGLGASLTLPGHLGPIRGVDTLQRSIDSIRKSYDYNVGFVESILETGKRFSIHGAELEWQERHVSGQGKPLYQAMRALKLLACFEYLHDQGAASREMSADGAAIYSAL